MNGIAEALDQILRLLEIAVFFCLLFYIRKPALVNLFKGEIATENHYEISVFITTTTVILFHFIGNALARGMLSSGMEANYLIDIFYSVMALVEAFWLICVVLIHKILKCKISKITRFCIYFSPLVVFVHLILYSERVLMGTKYLTMFGRISIIVLSIATLAMLFSYVIYRVINQLAERNN